MTCEEVGHVMGLSGSRVSQIERRALEKLRRRRPRELAQLQAMVAELNRDSRGEGVVQSCGS